MTIKLTMLGTGSPRPDLARMGPAQALHLGGEIVLIDCGEGALQQLLKAQIPPGKVNYIFITHLHSDHYLGYLRVLLGGWQLGRERLTIVGPTGIKQFHEKILALLKEDIRYRLSLGTPAEGILDAKVVEIVEPGAVSCGFSATVTAALMHHNVPNFAYRFQIGHKSVVITGDTAPNPDIIRLAKGANCLVHDSCMAATPKFNENNPEVRKKWELLVHEHCTPAQAAVHAEEAGVEQLVLTHFLPDINEKQIYEEAKSEFAGKIVIAKDLLEITI